ncbi:MAG: hypothetical protein ABI759_32285 [Candidatus Solibacter sp.]
MFFRRAKVETLSFQQRIGTLQSAGFTVNSPPGGSVRVSRGNYAADLKESDGGAKVEDRAGILMGKEIAVLVDGGFQKFFRTPGGTKKPALAGELKDLHAFEGDLKELLGLKNLYNEGLGTVSTLYQYDRVKDRDRGVPKRIWE